MNCDCVDMVSEKKHTYIYSYYISINTGYIWKIYNAYNLGPACSCDLLIARFYRMTHTIIFRLIKTQKPIKSENFAKVAGI